MHRLRRNIISSSPLYLIISNLIWSIPNAFHFFKWFSYFILRNLFYSSFFSITISVFPAVIWWMSSLWSYFRSSTKCSLYLLKIFIHNLFHFVLYIIAFNLIFSLFKFLIALQNNVVFPFLFCFIFLPKLSHFLSYHSQFSFSSYILNTCAHKKSNFWLLHSKLYIS